MERLLDTNVIIHLLTRNVVDRAEQAQAVLRRAEAGDEHLAVPIVVLFEVSFLLTRHFRFSRADVATRLELLLALPNLRVENHDLVATAVGLFGSTGGLSFADAYSVAYMRQQGITEVYTWDTDFDRVPGVTRVEPA